MFPAGCLCKDNVVQVCGQLWILGGGLKILHRPPTCFSRALNLSGFVPAPPDRSLLSSLQFVLLLSPGPLGQQSASVPQQSTSFSAWLRSVPDVHDRPRAHVHLHVHRLGRVKGVLVHGEVHLGTQPSELGDIVRGPPALRLGEVERVKAMAGRLEVDHRGAVEDGGEDVLVDLVGPLP